MRLLNIGISGKHNGKKIGHSIVGIGHAAERKALTEISLEKTSFPSRKEKETALSPVNLVIIQGCRVCFIIAFYPVTVSAGRH